mmetsp:Transcript_22277/g.41535  ORF Transcript_22277/g.41535 Transcript_22277/m.41535 type:complete len:220 (-) Transcript_22277:549-1208(-)
MLRVMPRRLHFSTLHGRSRPVGGSAGLRALTLHRSRRNIHGGCMGPSRRTNTGAAGIHLSDSDMARTIGAAIALDRRPYAFAVRGKRVQPVIVIVLCRRPQLAQFLRHGPVQLVVVKFGRLQFRNSPQRRRYRPNEPIGIERQRSQRTHITQRRGYRPREIIVAQIQRSELGERTAGVVERLRGQRTGEFVGARVEFFQVRQRQSVGRDGSCEGILVQP